MSTARDNLKIGDTVWVWDENRRVYPQGKGVSARPIWIEHWRPCRVKGETRVSWVLDWFDRKVPKRGDFNGKIAYSQAEIVTWQWVDSHRYKIAELVHRVKDPEVLEQIAELVGFKP